MGSNWSSPKRIVENISARTFSKQIWFDQNFLDVWGAFIKALKEVRYISGGADGAAIEEEEEDYALDFVSGNLEEHEDQENVPPLCDFILPTQESSSPPRIPMTLSCPQTLMSSKATMR